VPGIRRSGEIISSPGGTIDSLTFRLPNQATEANPVRISSLTVFCTSVQPKSASVRVSVIGAMRETSTSLASWRRVEGLREALRGSEQASLAHKERQQASALHDTSYIAGHEPQISPFLIDIWRLEIVVTLGKQRTATCSNRHVCGTLGKRNCSPQNSRRGGTLAAVWGRRGGHRIISRRGMR
jgi:hypothetical protein